MSYPDGLAGLDRDMAMLATCGRWAERTKGWLRACRTSIYFLNAPSSMKTVAAGPTVLDFAGLGIDGSRRFRSAVDTAVPPLRLPAERKNERKRRERRSEERGPARATLPGLHDCGAG